MDSKTDAVGAPHTPASLRVALGLNQAEAAARAGCSPATISDLEQGRLGTTRVLRALAEVYGVSVEYLIDAADRAAAQKGAR